MACAHNMDERDHVVVLHTKKTVTGENLFITNHVVLIALSILKPALTCLIFKKKENKYFWDFSAYH